MHGDGVRCGNPPESEDSVTPIEQLLGKVAWKRIELPTPDTRPTRSGLPVATHEGVLNLAGFPLRCYQLNNGMRVFDADDLQKLFGGEFVEESPT